MGIKYSFVDSELYGTEDINDIARSLVGAGIAPFLSKDSYNTSDLNALTQTIVEQGVQLDGCKVNVENVSTADMMANIGQGIVFFESGVRLTVDEDGYSVAVAPNIAGYIFAHYSPSLQKADIVFSSELPTDGEYVILAGISANGDVTDKRAFTRSKIATLGKNISLAVPFVNIDPVVIRTSGDLKYYKVARVQGVDISKFNYAVVTAGGELTSENLRTTTFYDLVKNQGIFSIIDEDTAFAGNSLGTVVNYTLSQKTEICDNELCIVAECNIANNGESYLRSLKNYTHFAMLM